MIHVLGCVAHGSERLIDPNISQPCQNPHVIFLFRSRFLLGSRSSAAPLPPQAESVAVVAKKATLSREEAELFGRRSWDLSRCFGMCVGCLGVCLMLSVFFYQAFGEHQEKTSCWIA